MSYRNNNSFCLVTLRQVAEFAYATLASNTVSRKLLKHLNLPMISVVKVPAECSRNVQSELRMRRFSRRYESQNIWTRT